MTIIFSMNRYLSARSLVHRDMPSENHPHRVDTILSESAEQQRRSVV
jgi:hypothetical protein